MKKSPQTDKSPFNCWDCGRIIEPDELRSIRHEVDPFGQAHDWRICQNCQPIEGRIEAGSLADRLLG